MVLPMKLLLDQNISHKLVKELEASFPDSSHVRLLGLEQAFDKDVWEYARTNGYVIVTQDSDFNERSLLFGHPPKIIWIRSGNVSSKNFCHLILEHRRDIMLFDKDQTLGCLQIY